MASPASGANASGPLVLATTASGARSDMAKSMHQSPLDRCGLAFSAVMPALDPSGRAMAAQPGLVDRSSYASGTVRAATPDALRPNRTLPASHLNIA
jgi:hypothetical protein